MRHTVKVPDFNQVHQSSTDYLQTKPHENDRVEFSQGLKLLTRKSDYNVISMNHISLQKSSIWLLSDIIALFTQLCVCATVT